MKEVSFLDNCYFTGGVRYNCVTAETLYSTTTNKKMM